MFNYAMAMPNCIHGLFVLSVDSCDRDRIDETASELKKMLYEYELENAVLLVIANKQDVPLAMSLEEIADKLNLQDIRSRKWHIQGACGTKGFGLKEGFDWLTEELGQV